MTRFSAPGYYQNILFGHIAPSRALSKMADQNALLERLADTESENVLAINIVMNIDHATQKESGGQKKRNFQGMGKWHKGDSE